MLITIGIIIIFMLLVIIQKLQSLQKVESKPDLMTDPEEKLRHEVQRREWERKDNEQTSKLPESVSDDLFLIKLELRLIRIDELLGQYGYDSIGDECESDLKTYFQHMFFCRHILKRHIFWMGDDPKEIKKEIDRLLNNNPFEEQGRDNLVQYADDIIKDRSREIENLKKWVLDQKTAYEFNKSEMDNFKESQNKLSRIEALWRVNRIQWRYEVLTQMEKYFKKNKNIDGWEYEKPLFGPAGVGCSEDHRPVGDF